MKTDLILQLSFIALLAAPSPAAPDRPCGLRQTLGIRAKPTAPPDSHSPDKTNGPPPPEARGPSSLAAYLRQ